MNQEFRFRGEEPGRLENFSDAVFALAITLLVISTSAPTNFDQIKRFLWDLIPFSICVVLIMLIWHQHFIFFFRYGLRNGGVVVLNTMFLIIVLFYVYPLKFLTKAILFPVAYVFDQPEIVTDLLSTFKGSEMGYLMIVYGVGATSVFVVLALMYRYAIRYREELGLSPIEEFDTRTSFYTNLLLGSVPLLSVIIAAFFIDSLFAGLFSGIAYFFYMPVMSTFGWYRRRRRKKLISDIVV